MGEPDNWGLYAGSSSATCVRVHRTDDARASHSGGDDGGAAGHVDLRAFSLVHTLAVSGTWHLDFWTARGRHGQHQSPARVFGDLFGKPVSDCVAVTRVEPDLDACVASVWTESANRSRNCRRSATRRTAGSRAPPSAAKSSPCGVRTGPQGGSSSMGSMWKMPPPSLLSRTTVASTASGRARAGRSCRGSTPGRR